MRWSSVFNLLPRLFPANDIQVTAAERGLLAFEAMNEVHEPNETVFSTWDEDAITLLKKDPAAYFRITREMRRDTPERRQAMRGALLAAQTDTERSIAALKESRWCQVHHETMFWCLHRHEGSAPVSPTVERVPSVSVTPPDTEGTTNDLQQAAALIRAYCDRMECHGAQMQSARALADRLESPK